MLSGEPKLSITSEIDTIPLQNRRTSPMRLVIQSAFVFSAGALILASCSGSPKPEPTTVEPGPAKLDPKQLDPKVLAFQAAAVGPPADWTGRVFKLSTNYPTAQPPPCDKQKVCTWLNVQPDFGKPADTKAPHWKTGKWADYMAAILAYMKAGQDPNLANERGFVVDVDGKTRWYHVPWMAYDPTVGREFIHGATNERTAHILDFTGDPGKIGVSLLPPNAVEDRCEVQWKYGFETWSVGAYNEYGGWAFGQAVPTTGPNAGVPQPSAQSTAQRQLLAGLPFPEGTMVMKILTTNAPVDCVPYLKGSPEWQIHRHRSMTKGIPAGQAPYDKCDREPQISRVVQLDVAVVDARSPTRWVYGTYVYDGTAPGATFWDRVLPLGVQWGADPKSFPAVPKARSGPILQTVLNGDVKLYEHEGCNKRLAGPVDNGKSSCISCHGAAFAPSIGVIGKMEDGKETAPNEPPIFGYANLCTGQDLQKEAAFFNNAPYPEPYKDPAYASDIPLDTSLQLLVMLNQYGQFKTYNAPAVCLNQ
jgi:hypothetical protein